MQKSAVILLPLLVLAGCLAKYDPTVWREECPSPDGAWIAIAHTDQYGGFGSAGAMTVVEIRRKDKTYNQGKPFEVLEIDPAGTIPATYKLSDINRGGGAGLTLRWSAPRRLDLSYDGKSQVDMQVVRFGDVTVTLRNSLTNEIETETTKPR